MRPGTRVRPPVTSTVGNTCLDGRRSDQGARSSGSVRGLGAHGNSQVASDDVEAAIVGSFRFVQETATSPGLRAPQLGAVHAILAHRSTETGWPVTVVMPTGTGKTDAKCASKSS